MKWELNVTAKRFMVLGNEGTVYLLPWKCVWEGKEWQHVLEMTSKLIIPASSQLACYPYFLIQWINLSFQGNSVKGGERWVFWSAAVMKDSLCSCCQERRFLSPLIMHKTHKIPGAQWMKTSTCLLQNAEYSCLGIFGWMSKQRNNKKLPCLDINLRVRCHHCSHKPQV